jgi:hypothetical protein
MNLTRRNLLSLVPAACFGSAIGAEAMPPPFAIRGYYLTLMRMPVMGLPEWKAAVDCFKRDGMNTLVLWMAGGFRSRKFPITWRYNGDHANVRQDFVRELIGYAQGNGIRVLLGFTPFGYDGVNQFPLSQPELKARKADGSPVDEFGIHCWGWSLCPALEESQRLMREYVEEMIFDFYPNADGLFIESSDYNVCQCPRCGPHHYEHEFSFVKWISEKTWLAKPGATILVYPHYFTGRKVPGLEAAGLKQPFDPRWGLAFTPHSAHFDTDLIQRAKVSVFSGPEAVLKTPHDVRDAVQEARRRGVSGYLPSLEAFSYVCTRTEGGEPYFIGKRRRPLGLDPDKEGKMPYGELLPRVQQTAVRDFSRDPDLTFEAFEQRLAGELFEDQSASSKTKDLLDLQRIWNFESDWYWSSPLLDPEFFKQRARHLKWAPEKLAVYDGHLARLKEIASTHSAATHPLEARMGRQADLVVQRWAGRQPSGLAADAR